MAKVRGKTRSRRSVKRPPSLLSDSEFERLGGGVFGYIRTMTSEEAQERFPSIENLPKGVTLYALHGADGTPIALTDTRAAAERHAVGDELELAALH